MAPRCAPPPSRRTTAKRSSTRTILASRSHPLHPPVGAHESSPAASGPRHARAENGHTPGWPRDAAPAAATPRKARTAPATKRTRHRKPSPPRNPRSVQIVRPPEGRPLKEGLDAGGVRRHRDPRQARCSMRSPRRLGCSDPSLHLLRNAHVTSSTPSMATTLQDDQCSRSSSEFRGTRLAAT